jgi:8-oxo-dGTP pyrophosphatase MutT (NUDIX family)
MRCNRAANRFLDLTPAPEYNQDMDRHMTVSGFVVHEDRVALHWHRKLQLWLPAGGHVEAGEDPLQAVLREVTEEFAVEVEVVSTGPTVAYTGGPKQIVPPYVILDCWVSPDHGHIDHVYFLRCVGGYPGRSHEPENPIHWLDEVALVGGSWQQGGIDRPFAPDVQALGIEAIRQVGAKAPAGLR